MVSVILFACPVSVFCTTPLTLSDALLIGLKSFTDHWILISCSAVNTVPGTGILMLLSGPSLSAVIVSGIVRTADVWPALSVAVASTVRVWLTFASAKLEKSTLNCARLRLAATKPVSAFCSACHNTVPSVLSSRKVCAAIAISSTANTENVSCSAAVSCWRLLLNSVTSGAASAITAIRRRSWLSLPRWSHTLTLTS